MSKLAKYTLSFFLLISTQLIFAHGGEDHGDAPHNTIVPRTYFSTVANSEKYELFLKYTHIEAGEETKMQLFVSEFNTNKPIDKADIKISAEDKSLKFIVTQTDLGVYDITTTFPDNKPYSLNVNINSSIGADLMVLKNIEPGKELPTDEETKDEKKSFLNNPWILFGGGFALALLIVFVLSKLKSKKANSTFLILILLFGTTPLPTQQLNAHGGEDHDHGDEGKNGSSNFSGSFEIPKETQFLFNVFTQKIMVGDFTESTKLYGTIIPSSNGQAIVNTPQDGKIVSLSVNVGQQVKKGQQLAVVEQNLDAASQVGIMAEKNNVDAEFELAKKEYERLKTIQDIASKNDFSEAEARYQKASENKKLYSSSGGRSVTLKSPIDGFVGNFTFTVGSTIQASEPVFTITNLSSVYVEAQVFDKDADKVSAGEKYSVECINDNHKTTDVKLIALAQSINPTNQSQRVLFEVENKDGEFKIGEFVNISVFASSSQRQIAVPNSAISELNGKPVVFLKEGAEQYSISHVSLGENNGISTVIKKGLAEGDRVVTNGTYQLKMIYLNQ
ncbi:MAG: efflux RND transporter periplasmic adaptor subunit [Bacteroidetes bacterium]|nr:efflux RND transporter periplasmic adaptor subunit [Bacteroidota bacterium]